MLVSGPLPHYFYGAVCTACPLCHHVGITHEELMVWCMQLAKAIPAGTSLALLKQLAVDRFAFAPLMTFAFFFVTSVIKVGTHMH